MKTIRIGDLGEIRTGSTPSKKNPDYYGDYALWIKPTDINPEEKYTTVVEEMFSEKAARECRTRMIPARSVCVPCIGTVGSKLTMTPCDCFVNQSINAIIPNENYDNDYVYYLLLNFLPNLRSLNKGTASGREYVAKSAFITTEIKVHSDIRVQRRIGEILSAYDDMIDNCKKQIALLEEAAQRIYREWFVYMRFPGHENTPIGENGLPVGWVKSTLKEFSDIVMGQSPASEFYNNESIGLPIHQGVSSYGRLFVEDDTFTSKWTTVAEPNSILFSVRAPVGRINITNNKIAIGRGLSALNQKEGHQMFLYLFLRNKFFKDNVIGNGTIYSSINRKELESVEVIIPSEELISNFEIIVSSYLENIKVLSKVELASNELKKSLLPRLISGQINIEV